MLLLKLLNFFLLFFPEREEKFSRQAKEKKVPKEGGGELLLSVWKKAERVKVKFIFIDKINFFIFPLDVRGNFSMRKK